MASSAPLIPDYQDRIVNVLEDVGISATYATNTFCKIERLRERGLDLHPTYNFKVNRNGKDLFFRALVRNDRQLGSMRQKTTEVLQQIDFQLPRSRRAFDVPHVVESGRLGPMVWDLEEFVDGRHLPCAWNRPSQLRPWLTEARKQVKAFEAIEQLKLDVPPESWAKQNRDAKRFLNWAGTQPDLCDLPLDAVKDVQSDFNRSVGSHETTVVHADPWQGNILIREGKVPVVLDWDEVHIGEPGEMYGRHWILMCSEPRWQEEVITAIGRRDDRFWLAFHAYAWVRAIDQIHYELTTFQGRNVESYAELHSISPKHAGHVNQMLKSLRVLAMNIGGPPPKRGQGARRYR